MFFVMKKDNWKRTKKSFSFCVFHNGFPLDLDDHKNKWSRHRPFLFGCDRSPGMHVLKLGTEIPNQEQHNWFTKWFRNSKLGSTITREEGLAPHDARSRTVPIRHMLSSKLACFHLPILIDMICTILLRISELFEQRTSSVINGLKVTPI